MTLPTLSISIVSHGHGRHVRKLLECLDKLEREDVEVILTLNIPEDFGDQLHHFSFPIIVVNNAYPKGFGANHNEAFSRSRGCWFVILNPDIQLLDDPFSLLLAAAQSRKGAIIAPKIVNDCLLEEDSARSFPSLVSPFKRYAARLLGISVKPDSFEAVDMISNPDWVAGMFMLLPRETMSALGGFDTRYFLYYEDLDLCARARLQGHDVCQVRAAAVIHNAQRDSHRRLRFFLLHLRSAFRFFSSDVYQQLRKSGMLK